MEKFDYMRELIEAGFTLIPLKGNSKFPFDGFPDTPYDMELDESRFPANYGVLLNDSILVVDVDPRNFEPNDKPHVRLFQQLQFSVKESLVPVVQTGSGGLHFYFRKPEGIHTKEKLKGFKGIDFKSTKGRFMVGPGSIHPDTMKRYQVIQGSFKRIPEAPPNLIQVLKSAHRRKAHEKDYSPSSVDNPVDVDRFSAFLAVTDAAVEGANGDQTTYSVACQGYSYGLSTQTTFDLMFKIYNPRCTPPWTADALWKKVENAYKYAQGTAGENLPEKEFTKITAVPGKHPVKWDRTEKGALRPTIQNCVNFFVLENSELAGGVAFDEFQGEVKVVKQLPWHGNRRIPKEGIMWTDDDTVQCRFYLNHKFAFDPKSNLLDEGVLAASHFFKIHPVREFLSRLVWDGTPRVHNWLHKYAGVPDDIYSRDVSKKVLVQAVARIFNPGVKVDNVVVLEGAQGIGKSSLVSIIGGKWYADIVIDPHARDTVDAMRGKWIIEFSEMEVTRRADAQALKAFITRQSDRVRLAYGRRSIDYPRQCVFMGTINPDASHEYFTDTTGNRRYWPVVCGNIKFHELERDREQLLAEAVDMYFKGETLHVEDKHVLSLMSKEQDARLVTDPWTDSIVEFLHTNDFVKTHHFTTTRELWEYALRGSPTMFSRHQSNRICQIMRKLGWSYNAYNHPVQKELKMKAFKLVDAVDFNIPDLGKIPATLNPELEDILS